MAAKKKSAFDYDAQNLARAEIVLADVEGHGGEESLMVQWARLVVKNQSVFVLTAR